MRRKDYYAILGLPRNASANDVRGAYRLLAKRHHPDAGGDPERFRDVQEAYETLENPERRRGYDLSLGQTIAVDHGRPAARRAEPVPSGGPFSEFAPWITGSTSRHRSGLEIVLSPEEAARGGALRLEVPVEEPCPACAGSGQGFFLWCWDCDGLGRLHGYRRVVFDIPPGVEHGAVLVASPRPGLAPLTARVQIAFRY